MVKRLVVLKEVVQDLGNPDTYLTPHQLDEAEQLAKLLEKPYIVTQKFQVIVVFNKPWKITNYISK